MKRTNETKEIEDKQSSIFHTRWEGNKIGHSFVFMDEDGEAMRIELIENINAYGQILLCMMWCENNIQIDVINRTLCYAAYRVQSKNAKHVKSERKKKGKMNFSASAGHHRQ